MNHLALQVSLYKNIHTYLGINSISIQVVYNLSNLKVKNYSNSYSLKNNWPIQHFQVMLQVITIIKGDICLNL